jgi:hypothetical protein
METKMNGFKAVAIAEGFEEADSREEILIAWAYLIKTGMVWQLQGKFGRTAKELIEHNFITERGVIQWEYVNPQIN